MKSPTKKIQTLILLSSILFLSCEKDDKKPAEEQNTPNYTNFKVTSLKITAMPFLDKNSSGWDPVDGPDVFFKITDGTNILLNGSDFRFKDVLTSELPLSWNFTNAHQITNIGVTQFFEIWDYDSLDPNDFIESVGFKLEDDKSGYPTTITKTFGSLTISITGNWY